VAYIFSAMRPQNLPQKHPEIQNGARVRQRFVARDSLAVHAAICAAVPTHVTVRLAFAFSFLFFPCVPAIIIYFSRFELFTFYYLFL